MLGSKVLPRPPALTTVPEGVLEGWLFKGGWVLLREGQVGQAPSPFTDQGCSHRWKVLLPEVKAVFKDKDVQALKALWRSYIWGLGEGRRKGGGGEREIGHAFLENYFTAYSPLT